MQKISIEYLSHHDGLPGLRKMSAGASGFDVPAAVSDDLVVPSGRSALVPTGFKLGLPPGYEAQIRPRSGLAVRHQVTLLNSPGTIDADYRGEVKIIVMNHGESAFTIRRGDRIAQLVVQSVPDVEFEIEDELTETTRGAGGFGHTGT